MWESVASHVAARFKTFGLVFAFSAHLSEGRLTGGGRILGDYTPGVTRLPKPLQGIA